MPVYKQYVPVYSAYTAVLNDNRTIRLDTQTDWVSRSAHKTHSSLKLVQGETFLQSIGGVVNQVCLWIQ